MDPGDDRRRGERERVAVWDNVELYINICLWDNANLGYFCLMNINIDSQFHQDLGFFCIENMIRN